MEPTDLSVKSMKKPRQTSSPRDVTNLEQRCSNSSSSMSKDRRYGATYADLHICTYLQLLQSVKTNKQSNKQGEINVAQINYVSRNQLHCTAILDFGLMYKKTKHCWALSTNFLFLFS